jgi:hypothetical protein
MTNTLLPVAHRSGTKSKQGRKPVLGQAELFAQMGDVHIRELSPSAYASASSSPAMILSNAIRAMYLLSVFAGGNQFSRNDATKTSKNVQSVCYPFEAILHKVKRV